MQHDTTKVTVHLPGQLLRKALKATGQGTTETIRQGLTLVAGASAYDSLRRRLGKTRIRIDVAKLRDDT